MPDIEALYPNPSSAAPSDAISLAVWVHVISLFSETYAEPKSDKSCEPTTTMSPEIEIAAPNISPAAASDAISLTIWIHVVPLFSNTYADPEVPLSSFVLAPTTARSPMTETAIPNQSLAAASDATSLAVRVHVVPLFSNT